VVSPLLRLCSRSHNMSAAFSSSFLSCIVAATFVRLPYIACIDRFCQDTTAVKTSPRLSLTSTFPRRPCPNPLRGEMWMVKTSLLIHSISICLSVSFCGLVISFVPWLVVIFVCLFAHTLKSVSFNTLHVPCLDCGSCWAHGSISALADRIKIARKGQGEEINLSIQFILNCGTEVAGSCHGGYHTSTYQFIKDTGYIPFDTCLPYLACSAESTEGFCPHVDTTCSAVNTCKTVGFFCTGVSQLGRIGPKSRRLLCFCLDEDHTMLILISNIHLKSISTSN